MALMIFHPNDFGINADNMRVTGAAVTGPPSWSGARDVGKTDGGGRWYMDLGDAVMIDREKAILWRAKTTNMDDGATPFLLVMADRRHQPVKKRQKWPVDDNYTPHNVAGAYGTIVTNAPLRAVSLTATVFSELPLIGGERFAIKHATWGWRAYQMIDQNDSGANKFITFRPPLREAVTAGMEIELDTPRCVVHLAGANPGASRQGRLTSGQISLVEYMRPAT